MEAETLLNLFDSYWFKLDIFKKNFTKDSKIPEIPSSNQEIPKLPTIHTKSSPAIKMSSNFESPKKLADSSASPNSVLLTPKLQTIFSGKIPEDFEDSKSEKEEITTSSAKNNSCSPLKGNSGIHSKRRKKKGLSKSLSHLEFEELKGFMDLGFVFSEDDKDSALASIIPGLLRLGNNNSNSNIDTNINNKGYDKNYYSDDKIYNKVEDLIDKSKSGDLISRPYLSETWEVLEKRKENSLLNWRVPASNSEVQMKDYLRFWAHTVASTVR